MNSKQRAMLRGMANTMETILYRPSKENPRIVLED